MHQTIFTSKLARILRDTQDLSLLLNIRHACRQQQAFWFSAEDAVLVLRPRVSDGMPYVLVWLAVSTRRKGLEHYLPTLQYLTRRMGGRWAEFYTVRQGFIRIARRVGFERMADEEGFMRFRIPVE
ncbi:TPA: hypothetical protein PXP51_001581 [Yersinia enterocolitica]|nr:hypothetical protein [Yersinia enterocolitica]HDL7749242.1 hypothetical protein [Yersinia enterocolitica]HDL7774072.1 hypothetical protein [Yersinia enterocolitica]HDL7782256.1 hypothetical protein [Yersinia enterocolitica]HEN3478676.1 hypothetical protein [Yersinia enterocolitica]